MATVTNAKYNAGNGIIFNNVKTAGLSFSTGPIFKSGSYRVVQGNNGEYEITRLSGSFLNAVDIDWNSAVLPNNNITIETTADLLSFIDSLSTLDVSGLETPVIGIITNNVNNINDILDVLTQTQAEEIYLTKTDAGDVYISNESALQTFATKVELESLSGTINSDYLTKTEASGTYVNKVELENNEATWAAALNDITTRYALKTEVEGQISGAINDLVSGAPAALDTLKEIADKLSDNDDALTALTNTIADKANANHNHNDVYETLTGSIAKKEELELALSELSGSLTTTIENVSGTLNEFATNVVTNYATKQELETISLITGPQGEQGPQGETGPQGEQGPTGTFDSSDLESYATKDYVDQKIEDLVSGAPAALDTLKEIADKLGDNDDLFTSLNNAIDDKAEQIDLDDLTTKYNALLTLLNLRESDVNNIVVNQALEESNEVTLGGIVNDIKVPDIEEATITANFEDNSEITLTSATSLTINNTSNETTDFTINVAEGGTIEFGEGDFGNITINSESNDPITLIAQSGASVTLNAPTSTVTLEDGEWVTISGEVGDNTLIIKHGTTVQNLHVTKGNVVVELDANESINDVITGEVNISNQYKLTCVKPGTYNYIYDETSWNNAYNDETSGLRAYYDSYPDEDRWVFVDQEHADNNNPEGGHYGLGSDKVNGEWPSYAKQCWWGAKNAAGAKYPWIAVTLPKPFYGTIEFVYDGGTPVYPWGSAMRAFKKGFGIASIPEELGNEFLLDANGETTFDISKLEVNFIQEFGWEYVYDEATWNASYAKVTMKTYYEWADSIGAFPYKEDLWNEAANRAANWNDIVKDGNNQPIEYEDGYHYVDGNGNDCVRCWKGAKGAPGAKYPWSIVSLPTPFTGKIKYVYDNGEPQYPFNMVTNQETHELELVDKTFTRGFGIESIPAVFGDQYLIDSNEVSTFDTTKLQITLVNSTPVND